MFCVVVAVVDRLHLRIAWRAEAYTHTHTHTHMKRNKEKNKNKKIKKFVNQVNSGTSCPSRPRSFDHARFERRLDRDRCQSCREALPWSECRQCGIWGDVCRW